MRLAYICADAGIPVFGYKGCSLHVQEMLRSFLNMGIEVTLFTSNVGTDIPADLASVNVIALPKSSAHRKTTRKQREQYAMQSYHWFMWKLFQQESFDLVYERYSLWSHVGVDYANEQDIPVVLEVNAPLIDESKNYRGLIHENQAKHIAKRNFQHANLISCVSQAVAEYVHSVAGKNLPVMVIPNAVNPTRFALANKQSNKLSTLTTTIRKSNFIIGFVGTLKPWHGLDNLVNAVALLHRKQTDINASLLIIGDGPQRQAIEELAREKGIADKLNFTGAVKPDVIPELLQFIDVAVAPYPELDNFYFSPLKVFEYMAAGLAVVASDIGQIKELIEHGKTGLLVKPDSVVELTLALQQLYQNPIMAKRLGHNAQTLILHQYTWDGVAKRVLDHVKKQPSTASSLEIAS